MFVFTWWVTGTMAIACYTAAFVWTMEIAAGKWKIYLGMSMNYSWPTCRLIIAGETEDIYSSLDIYKCLKKFHRKVRNHGEGPYLVPTSAFTFKTLLRHYSKWALTPRSLNVKLGPRRKGHKGRAVWLA